MTPTFITLTLLLGILGVVTFLLAGSIMVNSWKLNLYIKENYKTKLNSYKENFSVYSPTKIISVINEEDQTLIESATRLEKRTRYFVFLFAFCFLSIGILTALGFFLSATNKF